jgi:hypothetical protein
VSGLRGRERREMKKGKEKTGCFRVFVFSSYKKSEGVRGSLFWRMVDLSGLASAVFSCCYCCGSKRGGRIPLFGVVVFFGAGPGVFRWLLIGKAYHQCLYDDG